MPERRIYNRPPLIEALCHFRFEPGQEWDLTIPGLLYDRIKEDFPQRKQQHSFEVEFGPDDPGSVKRQAVTRVRFSRPDGTALVQVGHDVLIVNVLRPYPGWETFRTAIIDVLKQYEEVAPPKAIKFASLRYINRLDFNAERVEIEDFLNFYPTVPPPIPQDFGGWAQTVEAAVEFGLLRIRAGSNTLEDETIAFALDIDVTSPEINSDVGSMPTWMDDAHRIIEDAFEACITDKARGLFEEMPHEQSSVR